MAFIIRPKKVSLDVAVSFSNLLSADKNPTDLFATAFAMAQEMQSKGDLANARTHFKEALQVAAETGRETREVAAAHRELGGFLVDAKDFGAAADHFREAIRVLSALPADAPQVFEDIVQCTNCVAHTLVQVGQLESAEKLLRQSLASVHKAIGVDSPLALTTSSLLASVLVQCSKHDEAKVILAKTVQGNLRVFGEDNSTTLESIEALANILQEEGDTTRATTLLQQVVQLRQKTLGHEHPSTQQARQKLDALTAKD